MDNWQNGLILILITIFILGYCFMKIQKILEEKGSERQYEGEKIENEKKIEEIALLNELIVSDILKYYIIPNCSTCLSESFVLIQMSSLGNSVRIVCKICGSKKWIKTEDRNKNLSFIYNRYKDLFKLEGETHHFSDIELNTNIREDANI